MTDTDTLLPCEHCGCRFGYHEAGCAALIDDIVSVAVTGFKADMERILADHSTPPTPATDEREAANAAAFMALRDFKTWPSDEEISTIIDATLAAIADKRAAEILAAEANERARIATYLNMRAEQWRDLAVAHSGDALKWADCSAR